jgi:hypothetical protein
MNASFRVTPGEHFLKMWGPNCKLQYLVNIPQFVGPNKNYIFICSPLQMQVSVSGR